MAIIKFSSFLLLPLMVFALILMPIISGQTCRLFDSTSIPEERWESASKCNASCKSLVHSKCATHKTIWDGRELEWEPEEYGEIEDVAPFKKVGDDLIKYFSHEHHLKLEKYDGVRDADKRCQACISAPKIIVKSPVAQIFRLGVRVAGAIVLVPIYGALYVNLQCVISVPPLQINYTTSMIHFLSPSVMEKSRIKHIGAKYVRKH
ncbi:hypothetical protein ISN45_Aa07g034250 [Arabidopsis thaliana x Arabidopsis arenosa]|uniref:Transmembrane protein n=1 Tax=Arabidopsis thaliana x Arabidopsis arenosa TaxID=1240361 RepID=A0A8T1Y9R5_9BRAS|nr:hypothetical protein ISN45_Aa07g034250 [Arabidopsis thaliana x Arabidopsis arenosa]